MTEQYTITVIDSDDAGGDEDALDALIYEQGNGFPDVGDYCAGAGNLYRVVSMEGRIMTGDVAGNCIAARVESVEWDECAEGAEHTAKVEIVDAE